MAIRGAAAAAATSSGQTLLGAVAMVDKILTSPGPILISPSGPIGGLLVSSSSIAPGRPLVVSSGATKTRTGSSRFALTRMGLGRTESCPSVRPVTTQAPAGAAVGERD